LIDRLLAEAEDDKKPHQSVEFFVTHLLNLRVGTQSSDASSH
jgi:hypothetical protein